MLQSMNMQERFKHGEAVSRELVIIVGRGQHVQQGGPKLREAIEQLLRDQLHMDLNQVTPVSQLCQLCTFSVYMIDNLQRGSDTLMMHNDVFVVCHYQVQLRGSTAVRGTLFSHLHCIANKSCLTAAEWQSAIPE